MAYPNNWNPFDDQLKEDVAWQTAKMRLNKTPRKANRCSTGMVPVDDLLGGGLPEGLTILYGAAGSGKSKFAKSIASHFNRMGKKVLIFYGEDSFDSPPPNPPMLNNVDMVSYRPGPEKAVKTILKFVKEMKPDLVILDSLTTILGATSKAVPEADVREWTGELAARLSGIIPVLGISEIRGSGYQRSPAGGWGVAHAGLQILYFDKVPITKDKWQAQEWGAPFGSMVWTVFVEKDRDGAARQGSIYRITYAEEEIFLEAVVRE